MFSANPFNDFRFECQSVLQNALKKVFPEIKVERLVLEKPPSLEFGQLASSLCFELAKKIGEKPLVLAEQLIDALDKSSLSLVEKVVPAGGGYINFHVNFAKFSALTLESVRHGDTDYGFIKTDKPSKIIVEHTSVNPIHPIHIGQARNPMLGDAIARMLKSRAVSYTHLTLPTILLV